MNGAGMPARERGGITEEANALVGRADRIVGRIRSQRQRLVDSTEKEKANIIGGASRVYAEGPETPSPMRHVVAAHDALHSILAAMEDELDQIERAT